MDKTQRRPGLSLLEVLVVTAISILILAVGTYLYLNCIRIYRETQGLVTVFETSKIIERQFHDYLGHVANVPGNWINPYLYTPMAPGSDASWDSVSKFGQADWKTLDYSFVGSNGYYRHRVGNTWETSWGSDSYIQAYFTGPQDRFFDNRITERVLGLARFAVTPSDLGSSLVMPQWTGARYSVNSAGNAVRSLGHKTGSNRSTYWLPAYFGWRDASTPLAITPNSYGTGSQFNQDAGNGSATRVLESNGVFVGSWGWPRADYRIDIDADAVTESGTIQGSAGTCACWFYMEDSYYTSTYSMALDTSNLALCSIKFKRIVNPKSKQETTQLSFLRHHMLGWDHSYMNGRGSNTLCEDVCPSGNMLRAVKITPYYLDAGGMLQPVSSSSSSELGVNIDGTMAGLGVGNAVPRCFEVTYRLRHEQTRKDYQFCTRITTRLNIQ